MEKDGNKEKFATLSLFIDWALHIKIDRNINGFKILQEIDEELASLLDPNIHRGKSRLVFYKKMKKLWNLQGETGRFLRNKKIGKVFRKKSDWLLFQRLLLNILSDSPLSMDQTKLKYISKIFFTISGYGGWPTRNKLLSDAPFPRLDIVTKKGIPISLSLGYIFNGKKVN